jgi:hypothetical protein
MSKECFFLSPLPLLAILKEIFVKIKKKITRRMDAQ